ncbi:hypothetical protein [uncultured Tenacibaculum sp.]|uniref:hypothetical protein n=1 Tax=uncultured Tenacibaculum sp. TaxID=174713 RepID=UPI002604045E|nr:hypothetical protein [uncultured Tenacibaculum sp.]
MKIGQNSNLNCAIKLSISIYYSETAAVFYVNTNTSHIPPNGFKKLITCKENIFKKFVDYLGSIKNPGKPKFYSYEDMKNTLNGFLFTIANNCKQIENAEVKQAS